MAGYLWLLCWSADRIKKSNRILVCLPGLIVFFAGSVRRLGVDRAIYVRDYNERSGLVGDSGYQFVADVFFHLGFPFEVFSLTLAIITFVSIVRLSRFFKVNFIYLFTFYFVFFFILRDFAHMRVAISGALIALAFGSNWRRFLILSALAVSFHLSSIVAVLGLMGARVITRVRQKEGLIVLIILAALGVGFFIHEILAMLSSIDYRIQHYQIIDKPLYGNQVSDYTGFIFHLLVLFFGSVLYVHKSITRDAYFEQIILMQLFGCICFLVFKDISIFAFRLSHLFFSFFPVIILKSFVMLRNRTGGRFAKYESPFLLIVFSLLFFRDVSFRVLDTIGW